MVQVTGSQLPVAMDEKFQVQVNGFKLGVQFSGYGHI
jgi:hypothetical protein